MGEVRRQLFSETQLSLTPGSRRVKSLRESRHPSGWRPHEDPKSIGALAAIPLAKQPKKPVTSKASVDSSGVLAEGTMPTSDKKAV
jgi:hypothetical protein